MFIAKLCDETAGISGFEFLTFMEHPIVSVLVTVYNREKYLSEAVESILGSTLKNFELIIVDDRSTDGSYELARKLEKQDPRIRVSKNEVNLGDYGNRNMAASLATGKYLKYVDADDKIFPHGLEIMVNAMEHFPEAGWGVASLRQDDNRMFPFCLTPKEAYTRVYLNTESFIHSKKIFSKAPLSAIIRRDVFQNEKGFNNVRHFGDGDMWNRLGRKYPVVLMQDGVVWWRGHEDQEHKKRKKNYAVTIRSWNNIIEHLTHPDCPIKSEVRSTVSGIRQRQYRSIFDRIRRLDFAGAGEMYRELKKPSVQ